MAQSTDERSYRRLIRRYTARRQWEVVQVLFSELGYLLLEEAALANEE